MLTEQERRVIRRRFLLDALTVVLSAIGAILSFRNNGWPVFQYYTLDSNLLLLFACAAQAWYEAAILAGKRYFVPSWASVFKYIAVCTTTVTFTVVLLILVPMAGGLRALPFYLTAESMLYHHTLCPILGFVSFVFADRASMPDRRVTLWALVPTLLYAVVAIILNVISVLNGPYPFLRVHEQPAMMSVVWLVMILGIAWVLAHLVWKLAQRFSEPRELPDAPDPESEGWTEDGYICDQDCFSAYTYRTIPAHNNSCGPVAAFDLRRHEGHDARFADVLAEMDGMHLLRMPGPTFMYVMRRYLHKYLPGWREVHGRDAALAAAERSRMGMFRYHEQRIPHFVAYYRLGDGAFRFFNVNDKTIDAVLSMADFGSGHLCGGSVKLIYWE